MAVLPPDSASISALSQRAIPPIPNTRTSMNTDIIKRAIQAGWDDMSTSYQEETRISLDDVHYAPLCPGERELQLLGEVRDQKVLEIACGGAQNSIALAKWGARVTAIDFSQRQLRVARRLVENERVNVDLIRADAESLAALRDNQFDIVMSSFGWEFIPDLDRCLHECFRVLRAGGRLVMCTVHPLTAFEWDDRLSSLQVTDYFNPPVEAWEHSSPDNDHPAMTFFRTVQEMFELLASNGFSVDRIVEPYPQPIDTMSEEDRLRIPYSGDFWEGQYERLRRVPFAIIFVARKVASREQ